jgi:hypothetical protein
MTDLTDRMLFVTRTRGKTHGLRGAEIAKAQR